jgi:tetratricopeptide (TPR) repeat protein
MDRLEKLTQLLSQSPGDAFLLYAIAMEHKKADNAPAAVEFFDRVIQIDPGYCYAYYQKGLLFESTGDMEGAKAVYRQGIAAAERKGDLHAKEEINAALTLLD